MIGNTQGYFLKFHVKKRLRKKECLFKYKDYSSKWHQTSQQRQENMGVIYFKAWE